MIVFLKYYFFSKLLWNLKLGWTDSSVSLFSDLLFFEHMVKITLFLFICACKHHTGLNLHFTLCSVLGYWKQYPSIFDLLPMGWSCPIKQKLFFFFLQKWSLVTCTHEVYLLLFYMKPKTIPIQSVWPRQLDMCLASWIS